MSTTSRSHRAAGTFDLTATPHPPYDTAEGATLGRTTFEKRFHGPLDATSVVEMLSARSPTKGSAGYVALERVAGVLDGRAGTFVLQHSGTMDRGSASLSVTVVPDTGTGALAGLRGELSIEIAEGVHRYVFAYDLGDAG